MPSQEKISLKIQFLSRMSAAHQARQSRRPPGFADQRFCGGKCCDRRLDSGANIGAGEPHRTSDRPKIMVFESS
jgi:hypothetical protein